MIRATAQLPNIVKSNGNNLYIGKQSIIKCHKLLTSYDLYIYTMNTIISQNYSTCTYYYTILYIPESVCFDPAKL